MSTGSKFVSDASKPESRVFRRLPPQSVVYWSRIGFAALGGVIYNILGASTQGPVIGAIAAVGIGVLTYILSVAVVMYVLGYGPDQLSGPRKHISIGMGSYTVWLIFTIILLNTILHPSPA